MSHTDQGRPAVTPTASPAAASLPRHADGLTGPDLLRILARGRWILAGCVALALACAGAYLLAATARWRAESLLRLEERREHFPGEDPITTGLEAPLVDAEIEVLRARTLLERAVERAHLDVSVEPRRVPLLGKAAARLHRGAEPARAPLGLVRFAWGGERLSIAALEVPPSLVDQALVLAAEDGGGFRLSAPDGATLARGAVGKPAEATDGAGRALRVSVTELVARPGTEFVVRKLRTAEVAAALQLQYSVQQRGKDTGVVALQLEGTDRARITAALAAILDLYLAQNAQRVSARAARTVALLERRLPQLRAAVERADDAVESWKLANGTVDVSAETRALLERSVDVSRRVADLQARRYELEQRYTDRHPGLDELSDQIEALRIQQSLVEAKLRTLPTVERQVTRLTRDVHAATALYLQVLERAQQYKIAASGSGPSAVVVDPPATPEKPFAPRAPPVLALALVLGVVAGVAIALVRSRMGGFGDATEVEVATGLPVLGALPHSSTEASIARAIRRRLTGQRAAALHAVNPGDVAVEDLRTLRTNLAAALRGATSNVVAVGGPAPGVGKSFVCVNLGLLLASTRRKVLLVDADLRRGRLHREFGIERTPGVAEVIAGAATFDAAVRPSGTDGLDVLAAGEPPDDPTALLEGPRFPELLAEAAKRYDVVLVDTAAILAVTDPALVARHAGLSLLVLRAGEHPLEDIALAVKRLRQGGARVDAAVLNDVRPGRHARYRYEYRARAGA